MAFLINVAVNDNFTLRDNADAALTGKVSADFATVEAYQVSAPGTTATVTMTEIGLGEYRIAFTPTTAAMWSVHVVYNSGGVFREYLESYDVLLTDPTTTVVVISTSATGALQLSLAELRRRVADRFGDYVELTATGNGTTTTFVDVLNVNSGAEHYNGRYLYFTSGSNDGSIARVTSTTDSSGTLTFTPDYNSTAGNDTCDVFNKRGIGFSPAEYKRAINNAINDAYPLGFIEIVAEIAGTFDSAAPEITVPTEFTDVHSVEWQDIDDLWHSIPQATKTNEWGWFPDAAAGEIRIQGRYALDVDGFTIRFTGYGRQSTLTNDTDTCSLNAEYIVSRAAYHLAAGSLMRDPTFAQLAQLFQGESERMRTRVRTVRKAETRKVRAA